MSNTSSGIEGKNSRGDISMSNDLGNRRDAFGASVLTDGLCGNGTEVGAGDTAKG